MKINEVKGGLKLFHGGGVDNAVEPDHTIASPQRISNLQRPTIAARQKRLPPLGDGIAGIGRRKAWTAESSSDQKTSMQKNSGNNNGGDPKSPIQSKKTRSSTTVPGSVSPSLKKTRSSTGKSLANGTQSVINVSQLRKSKSESSQDENADVSAAEENSIDRSTDMCVNKAVQIGKVKSETEIGRKSLEMKVSGNASDCDASKRSHGLHTEDFEEEKDHDDDVEKDNEKDEVKENNASDEVCEEIGLCPEELIPKDSVGAEPELPDDDDHSDSYEDENNGSDVEEEVVDIEAEDDDDDDDDEVDEVIEADRDLDVKEIDAEMEVKDKEVVNDVKIKLVSKVNRINNVNANSKSPSTTISKLQDPLTGKQTVKLQNCSTNPGPNPTPNRVHSERFKHPYQRLQSLVDLVMWRDVSRSAFVFGFGSFIIISSSYTKDLNISLISVLSYLGLAYLCIIFLYRTLQLCRGVEPDQSNCNTEQYNVLGEEDAFWMIRLILPYLNEFLLKLRDLFSGDPAMTMKLAVVLFVLARCGKYFTVWRMLQWGFIGVFIVPKLCSLYSTYLTAYGKFWIRRFQDAWESCSHKKAVAFGIFTLVWNLSSVVARIWAAFMLLVAFRYYQQHYVIKDDQWSPQVDVSSPSSGGRRMGVGVGVGGSGRTTSRETTLQARPRQLVGVRQVGQWRTKPAAANSSVDARKQKRSR